MNQYTYGNYECFKNNIKCPEALTEFTIQIEPLIGDFNYMSDYIDIKSINKNKIMIDDCSSLKSKDIIRLFDKNTENILDCKIISIDKSENKIKIDKEIKNNYTYIMNLHLQNTIYYQ